MSEQLERYRWLIVALFAVPLLSGIGFLLNDRLKSPQPLQINSASPAAVNDIRIYVTGAVRNPGVYSVHEGDRWLDAVQAAGGPAADANLDAVNLARRVQDEDQIVVPRVGQQAVAGASQGPLIDINTASEPDLKSLPGIGDVRASAIVKSRTSDGPYASIDDLVTRHIIPQSVFDKIAGQITVSQ